MSDKMRWGYGDTNPVVAAVDSGTVIEMGDLLWQDVDDAKPASMLKFQPAKTAPPVPRDVLDSLMPELFADKFLGVAMQHSRNGDATPIRVATTGVFEFDVPEEEPITYELGDLIGPAVIAHPGHPDYGSGVETLGLMNQTVEKVSQSYHAIGRAAKREASNTTSMLVDIRSTVMTGGVVGSNRN